MRWQPLGIVYHLLHRCGSSGKPIPWIQKTISLANDTFVRRGEATPYCFVLYRGSVYSVDLEDDLQEGLSLGLFCLHPSPGGYGCLVVDNSSVLGLEGDSQWDVAIDRVLGFVSERPLPEIDKLSLASWFLARGYPADKVVAELHSRKKWTLSPEVAAKLVGEAGEWLGQVV